jgi:LuxR family maltose regulon positive regulatory protein
VVFHVPRSKITIPGPAPEHVRRPALEDVLDRDADRDLTLVCAPPGTGKTTLLASWVCADPARPTAWVRLDPQDADPRRLWSAVLAALTDLPAVPASSRLHRLVVSRTTVELDFLTELVECLATLPTRVRLVLDDAHHITDPASRHGLEMLVRTRPAGVRLVLATRRDPLLPLPRLRMEERLCELRTEQLAFTAAETTTLLERSGVALAPQQVALLHARTGGWVAGLRLAARELRDHPDPDRFLAAFSGDEHPVADYLVDEVLTAVGEQQRETLRRVSIAERLPAALAVELAEREDAADVLDDLVRGTGLVTGTGANGAEYRVAELLRSHLVADLGRHGPHLVSRLHRRAAQWWSDRDQPAEALAHAEQTGDTDFLADLLADWVARLVARGDQETVERALAAVGDRARAEVPRLATAEVQVHLARGDTDEVRVALRRARRAGPVPARSDDEAFRTATERLAGVHRPVTVAEPIPAEPALGALALIGRGAAALVADRPPPVDEMEAGLEIARRHRLDLLAFRGRCLLAAGLWVAGETRRAAVEAEAALADEAPKAQEDSPWAALARAVVAHTALLGADPRAALTATSRVRPVPDHGAALGRSALPRGLRFALRSAHGAAQFDSGERTSGLLELQSARSDLGDEPVPAALATTAALLEHHAALWLGHHTAAAGVVGWLAARCPGCPELLLLQAWTRAAVGSHDAARDAVAPLLAGDRRPTLSTTAIEARLVETRARLAHGDRPGARQALRAALEHAEPLDARRPFAHAGEAVRALLVDQLIGGGDRAAFAGCALAAGAGPREAAGTVLSSRELDVLTRLSSLESLDEIAADLDVSINTIKSHVRAIYGKLGVSSRRAAVLTAHEQGVLR